MAPATGNNAANSGAGPQPAVHYHYYGTQYPSGWYYSPNQYGTIPHKSKTPSIVGYLLIFTGIFTLIAGSMVGAFALNVGPMGDMMDFGPNPNSNDLIDLQGQIIFMNATPAANVNITIVDLNIMAQTNTTGYYKILNVEPGWHDLKVEYPGYKTLIQSVKVAQSMAVMNNDHDLERRTYVLTDFQLQPGSGDLRIGEAHETGALESEWENGAHFVINFATICLVSGVIGASFMFLGGYFALKRTKLPWVIVGCVFAMIFGSVLGMIALILVLMSTNEFKSKDKGHDEHGPRTQGGPGSPPEAPKAAEPKMPLSTPPTGPEKIGPPYGGYQYPVYSYPPNPIPQPTVWQY